jgi:uncharacterized protein
MAGSSLFALIDDIATLLDDIAVLSKVAVQKTAGVLGDDLALNAQQVNGIDADRELPVVWAVAKGSLRNKAILVPAAMFISIVANFAVLPLLMLGGIYLCFEGVEKLAHKWLHPADDKEHHKDLVKALVDEKVDMVAFEKDRIQGAIRTDFVLSAEIIVITLGEVAKYNYMTQFAVLVSISLIMTVGVYGLVGGIVKLDDIGLAMSKIEGNGWSKDLKRRIGRALLMIAPRLLNVLSVVGTIAMFTVGGGIVVHGIEPIHHFLEHIAEVAGEVTHLGVVMEFIVGTILNIVVGVLLGALALILVEGSRRIFQQKPKAHP